MTERFSREPTDVSVVVLPHGFYQIWDRRTGAGANFTKAGSSFSGIERIITV